MRRVAIFSSCALFLGLGVLGMPGRTTSQDPQAPEAPIPADDVAKKNPVKPTPEGLASAKKLFGYHCAMCHGAAGDGKGDLATDMKLKLKDWRDPSALSKTTDGEMFYIITNGRGKMAGGEGDRTSEEVRWNLVNYVRSFAKKGTESAKQ